MHGAISSLPNTPSWRGAQLRAQGHIHLYLLHFVLAGGYVSDAVQGTFFQFRNMTQVT